MDIINQASTQCQAVGEQLSLKGSGVHPSVITMLSRRPIFAPSRQMSLVTGHGDSPLKYKALEPFFQREVSE